MRARITLITAFFMALVVLLMSADMWLAHRAEQLYNRARQVAEGRASDTHMYRDAQKGWVIVKVDHVSAGLCNTFTGGLWFSMLLPKSRHIQNEHPTVSAAGGGCTLGDSNILIFTFSVPAKHF